MKKALWRLLTLLGLAYLVWAFILTNPFNWFVKKSSRFTMERFERVVPGMSKEELVELLGPPLRVSELSPSSECTGCLVYFFMGDPPEWLPGFQDAWVYVGPEGGVRDKILNTEP